MAFGLLHQRADDDGTGADDGRFMIEAAFGAQPRDRGAKAVDDRQAAGCRQQIGQACEGARAGRAEARPHIGLAELLARRAAP